MSSQKGSAVPTLFGIVIWLLGVMLLIVSPGHISTGNYLGAALIGVAAGGPTWNAIFYRWRPWRFYAEFRE